MNHIIIISFVIISIILLLVSLLTKKWSFVDVPVPDENDKDDKDDKDVINTGLWRICETVENTTFCQDVSLDSPDVPKSLNTIRILCISALVLVSLSLLFLILVPDNRELFVVSMILGGLCGIVGTIIYANNNNLHQKGTTLGYSWFLQLIGCIISLLIGLLVQFKVL